MTTVIDKVIISRSALSVFEEQVGKFGTIETGGVLLGYLEGNLLYIEKASEPGPKAVHESIYFRADPDYIDMVIDMEYANSDGKIQYIGEWHTHPQIIPEASEIDMASLEEIADSKGDYCIMIILGSKKFDTERLNECSDVLIKYSTSPYFYTYAPFTDEAIPVNPSPSLSHPK